MFKLIGKLLSPFDDLKSRPGELVEWVVLLVVALVGMFMAVCDVVGHPLLLSKHSAEITLGLVGLLGLHFCIERFTVMRRVEKGLDIVEMVEIDKRIPPKMKSKVNAFVRSHIRLQELRTHADEDNAELSVILDSILDEQSRQLQQLSEGKLDVPSAQTAMVNQELMSHYKKRFDAVSEDDLKYWAEEAAPYFSVQERAIRKWNTVITRIFILPINELRTDRLVEILETQQKAGIGWGIAIKEELDDEVAKVEIVPDFALYDRDKAVSIFRKTGYRRFETIFATHDNNPRIKRYLKLYRDLVPECWLVNKQFVENYSGALGTSEALEEVKKKGERNNKSLNERLRRNVAEDAVFVLVASGVEDVRDKVERLVKIVSEHQQALGKVVKAG